MTPDELKELIDELLELDDDVVVSREGPGEYRARTLDDGGVNSVDGGNP